jgi:hypothetical protein
MTVLVLKTNLDSDQGIDAIRPILNLHPAIKDWHVDTEDVDNVLRIESLKSINELDVIILLAQYNVMSETLQN